MTDWYYHEPGQGRVGPLTAEQMRERYRDRHLQRDTLAWHHNLQEWQPVERLTEELGLEGIEPDASLPPPLPPLPAAAQARTMPAASHDRPGHRRTAAATATESRRGLSGCAIVAIVLAVVAVPVIGILAAIAVPAYQDYTVRARVTRVLTDAQALQQQVDQHIARHGRCPGNSTAGFGPADGYATPLVSNVVIGELAGGDCAIELRLRGLGSDADGQTMTLQVDPLGEPSQWRCQGGSLPAKYRNAECR